MRKILVHRCRYCGCKKGDFHQAVAHPRDGQWYPTWETETPEMREADIAKYLTSPHTWHLSGYEDREFAKRVDWGYGGVHSFDMAPVKTEGAPVAYDASGGMDEDGEQFGARCRRKPWWRVMLGRIRARLAYVDGGRIGGEGGW